MAAPPPISGSLSTGCLFFLNLTLSLSFSLAHSFVFVPPTSPSLLLLTCDHSMSKLFTKSPSALVHSSSPQAPCLHETGLPEIDGLLIGWEQLGWDGMAGNPLSAKKLVLVALCTLRSAETRGGRFRSRKN